MKTEIYYFSGTGNSLYVARELHKIIPNAELIPIAMALRSNHIQTNGDQIGLVFPCHGLTIPSPVREFLKRVDVSAAQYFFAVATRGGDDIANQK